MSSKPSAVPILASRFLLSKASDQFLSFIAWVSVVGVALGVLALTVVTSVINGFEGELARVITGVNGDVILYSREPIQGPGRVEEKIRRVLPEALEITPAFVMELMASGPKGVSGAIYEGIDPGMLGKVTEIPKRVTQGKLPTGPSEIALGSAIAEKIGAEVGDEIRLVIPGGAGGKTAANEGMGAPRILKARVTGIVKMGMHEYDSKFVFATLDEVRKTFGYPDSVTSFKIRLEQGADSRAASQRLNDNFGFPFRAKDWAQLNKNLHYAIQLEKAVIAIILTVIVIVAAFNVVSTLMMMIHDKSREIAILKAMGFRPGQSFRLFCLIGLGMGMVGTVFGVSLGVAVNWILARTHWIDLPPEIYYIGFLPVVTRWSEVGLIAGASLLISLLATIYPAIRVSRRSPLEGLRYE